MKIMITYLNLIFLVAMASFNIACDKNDTEMSESFFYGAWNQSEENPNNFPFYYAEGFEFEKNNTAFPRYDRDSDGKFVTDTTYIGSWSFDATQEKITFTEDGSKFPSMYSLDVINDNKIKLSNPVTNEVYFYNRQ